MPSTSPLEQTPNVRRRDLRERSTRASRRAAQKRALGHESRESRGPRAAARRAITRPPLRRRIGSKLFPVVALLFVSALVVGTSVPASAFTILGSSSSASGVDGTVTGASGVPSSQAGIEVNGDALTVSRDAFQASSTEEYLQIQALGQDAGYTVNNSGPIRWPFDTPVPLGDAFGPRVAPCGGCSTFHRGTDFETGSGAPISAVAAGIVTVSEYSGALGQHVAITHTIGGETFTSIYGHLRAGSSPLRVGETVIVGQMVGLTGSTGQSTGPHLDFEIDIDGTPIDSFVWLKANTAH